MDLLDSTSPGANAPGVFAIFEALPVPFGRAAPFFRDLFRKHVQKRLTVGYARTVAPIVASPSSRRNSFQTEAVEAVTLVRDSFARIIELKCPGSKAVTALTDAFGIHRKLAWQVSKVAYAEDPFAAARHMPPAKSLDVWLTAARMAGVPGGLIDAARDAGARFEALAGAHASSRAEFEMLLESCGSGSDDSSDARWRQQAFLGNSYTWGAHCRTLMAICVLMPSDDRPHHFHAVQVRGLIGFRQTRPAVRWIVNQSVVADDLARTTPGLDRVPLDPRAADDHAGVPVLPAFCSDPMPALERRCTPDGMMHDEFTAGPVGQAGERTLVTGEIIRNIGPVYATEQDRVAHFGTTVRTPAEVLHFDLLVRRGLFGPVERDLRVFSDLASTISFDDRDALETSARIVRLGSGLGLVHTPDIPGYADLAASVCVSVAIDPDEYELFRVRMEYPPLPTSVMIRHPLLDRGEFA